MAAHDELSELAERWRMLLPGWGAEPPTAPWLAQGLAFHRSGRVTGLRLEPGRLSASIQGARATPYHVEALVGVLDEPAWRMVLDEVASELRVAAALLAGRWPDGLLDTLAARGVDLVAEGTAPDVRCPCGEAERPCAHRVALWEAAAGLIESDPFALLYMRGRGRQRFLADLAALRRARGTVRQERIPLEELPLAGWTRAPTPLEELDVRGASRAEVSASPLRLLGDPPGWTGATASCEAFAPLVEVAGRYAERIVRGELPE